MIAIIDYKAGNLTSVKRAMDFLDIPSQITDSPEAILKAERIIFPGVGHAAQAMQLLKERGLDKVMQTAFNAGTPMLGICLGSQIILSHSDEGDTECLDILKGNVARFALNDPALKVPHMGWDAINIRKPHPVLKGIKPQDEFYFVHAYYTRPSNPDHVYATCEYEIDFPAIIGTQNLIAMQFHPEKSGPRGLNILENFTAWDGSC